MYGDDPCPSLSPWLGIWGISLKLRGSGKASLIMLIPVRVNVLGIHVGVCVAQPSVRGA